MYEFVTQLKASAAETGFCAISADNIGAGADISVLTQWLERGFNASMAYMGRNINIRRDPSLLLEGAQSIIVAAAPYPDSVRGADGERYAGFALGEDYHTVLKDCLRRCVGGYLQPRGIPFRVFADSAPVLERQWAARCGLGFIGKNNFLISHSAGARVLLCCAVTAYRFSPEELGLLQGKKAGAADPCEGCSLCIRACPNGALGGRGRLDAGKCVSYHTVESSAPVPERLRTAGWIIGCEECLNACPYGKVHRGPEDTEIMRRLSSERERLGNCGISRWTGCTPEEFRRETAGTAFSRPGAEKIRGNAEHFLYEKEHGLL